MGELDARIDFDVDLEVWRSRLWRQHTFVISVTPLPKARTLSNENVSVSERSVRKHVPQLFQIPHHPRKLSPARLARKMYFGILAGAPSHPMMTYFNSVSTFGTGPPGWLKTHHIRMSLVVGLLTRATQCFIGFLLMPRLPPGFGGPSSVAPNPRPRRRGRRRPASPALAAGLALGVALAAGLALGADLAARLALGAALGAAAPDPPACMACLELE